MPELTSSTAPESPCPFFWTASDIATTELNEEPISERNETSWKSDTKFVIRRRLVHNSTAQESVSEIIDRDAAFLIAAASDSVLSDDYDTQFRRQLELFVRGYGKSAVDVLADLIVNPKADPMAASKVLEALGASYDAATFPGRFRLLEQGLNSPNAVIRYGAAVGLASLQDARALPALRSAVERETGQELRAVLYQVITFLDASR